jgi:hypothetical protein
MTKERLIILNKFTERANKGMGTGYRYKIDNKLQSSGAFHISLLPVYEEKYEIDWKESYLREVKGKYE